MAFMFLRKTICMDFGSAVLAENATDRRDYYLCEHKIIMLLLSHVLGRFDLALPWHHTRPVAGFPAARPAR
ncbi:MAG TPA: hypothetical protein DDZ81_18070 [Acetobacteraceae bacterium]|nr:hypothetical protein [Acetobacteraceae bacterium]